MVDFISSGRFQIGRDVLFMQGNALAHSAADVEEYSGEQGIQPIIWLPYSPDMNLIKNI